MTPTSSQFDQYDTDAGGPVIHDKRRIDPETGEVREAPGQPPAPGPGAGPADGVDDPAGPGVEAQLAERTSDLQRLQAEYANYRRRVERDRESIRQLAVSNVLMNLLPVLDDIGRARDHGELEGGFKSVADALESTLEKLGLKPFGSEGEPFDPTVHEALTHTHSADVTEPTCVRVFQPGYVIGDRVVRPARVAVADPAEAADAAQVAGPPPERDVTPAAESAADGDETTSADDTTSAE